ncbi:hypothetical protein AB0M20_36190 [Actinoplanes sp. NPDC051633]|uniref:hypothetical protein n=1 Tax=Actinoplanes sp. NPDC051633 TaxID=3155670 RepID=UPI003445AF6B
MKKVARRFALWRADLDGEVCAVPEECVETLLERDRIILVLEHREFGLVPLTRSYETSLRQDVEWQFGGITWPPDVRPGVLVTVSFDGGDEVLVRTVPLDEPLTVDGAGYFHEYDPRVVTREFDAGGSNHGRVLQAVRKQGRVFDDGSAVLAEAALAGHCGLGRGAKGTFLLRNALDQLIREGYLTRVPGSVDSAGYPSYPAVHGQKAADMLFYAPLVEEGTYPDDLDPDKSERREHWVNGFVRKLPPGARPSERQRALHDQAAESELAPGYTYVKKHHRHG